MLKIDINKEKKDSINHKKEKEKNTVSKKRIVSGEYGGVLS